MTNPASVNVTLDLNSLFVEPVEFDGDPVDVRTLMRNAVVEAAAAKLVAGFSHEEMHEMRQEVQRTRSGMVRERLAEQVETAMSEPVQRTTRWGEKKGEETTVRELIRVELEAFMNGTARRRQDPYGSSSKEPQNLGELIEAISREVVRTDLAQAVREAKAAVDKRVQEVLVAAIAEKLTGKR